MAGFGRTQLTRRALGGALVAVALCVPLVARAQDPAGALRDLTESTDFRVRVSAALYLGRTRPPGAREALERGLADSHPAVRAACANALGALGDPAAVGALARRLGSEPSASVKAQIQSSVEQLRQGGSPDAAPAASRTLGPQVRFVVKLGAMRNPTGIRGEELRKVLGEASRSRAQLLKGAAVLDDATLLAQATARHLPVLTLDGSLSQLVESHVEGNVQVQARVEFAVRKDQVLKGTLSGAATTFGSGTSISEQSRRRLQDDAVDGAVQSALRGAEQGLSVAAR